jgi:hypothetical protein
MKSIKFWKKPFLFPGYFDGILPNCVQFSKLFNNTVVTEPNSYIINKRKV